MNEGPLSTLGGGTRVFALLMTGVSGGAGRIIEEQETGLSVRHVCESS